jgi:hypothetical protein
MCPIQFRTDLIFLDFSDGIIQSKIEKQWRQSISLFQAILNTQFITQNLILTFFAIGFI